MYLDCVGLRLRLWRWLSQMAHSCWGLRAKRRWCLSGTPMQNSVDDLYSYFRFLRYAPYDDFAQFRKHLKDSSTGLQRLQAVLRAIMLRRTKSECAEPYIIRYECDMRET